MNGSPDFRELYVEEKRKREEADRAREIAEKGRQEVPCPRNET